MRGIYLKKCLNIYKLRKCIFIHIPKTGGTSIAYQLFGRRAGHYSAMTIKSALGNELYNSFFSFAIVRNPYRRVLSAYQFIKSKGGSDGGVFMKSEYRTSSFDTFESFVKDWLILQNPNEVDILFRPQYTFLCGSDDNILVDWVGQIENFAVIEKKLHEELGLSFSDIRKNITLEKRDIQLNNEIKKLIYDYYKRDFEIFKYSFIY